MQVRYLKIIEKSGYQALPWVRYITMAGEYELRLVWVLNQIDSISLLLPDETGNIHPGLTISTCLKSCTAKQIVWGWLCYFLLLIVSWDHNIHLPCFLRKSSFGFWFIFCTKIWYCSLISRFLFIMKLALLVVTSINFCFRALSLDLFLSELLICRSTNYLYS